MDLDIEEVSSVAESSPSRYYPPLADEAAQASSPLVHHSLFCLPGVELHIRTTCCCVSFGNSSCHVARPSFALTISPEPSIGFNSIRPLHVGELGPSESGAMVDLFVLLPSTGPLTGPLTAHQKPSLPGST